MPRTERPLDSDGSVLTEFAAGLRILREKAGGPPYRELARRAHFAASSLAEAAGGRKLPTLEVTLAYVHACGGDAAEWEERWRSASAEIIGTATDPDQAPYVGLSAFRTDDADRFFGRDKLVAQLCGLVAERRFVAVIGPSGSGKSSLLNAGLLHAREHGLHGLRTGPVVRMTPGPHPVRRLTAWVHEPDSLVVVDQFEELFTLCQDPGERASFIAALQDHHVVIGVRADFYAHCAQYPDLVDVLREGQLLVGPMTSDELRSIITGPATGVGCRVENTLVSTVIADATGQPGVLPLVSHALLETWRRRRGNMLTFAGYQAAGGIAEAIARTAEAAYDALSPAQRQVARDVFVRLVALGEGTEDTKRRLSRAELDPEAAPVLEHLARARLVTLDQTSVEIAHEALIRCWPQLRTWLDEDREGLRRHRELTDATDVWEAHDRDPGALYRGMRLALARDLTGSRLTSRERTFLTTSLAAETEEHRAFRRRSQWLRYLVALLAVLLVVSTVATFRAVTAENAVIAQRNTALSEKVAAEAVALRQTKPALAAQLSLAAHRLAPTRETTDGLISAQATTLFGHRDYVNTARFTPDGSRLVTGARDRTVRLWDVAERKQLSTLDTGHTGSVWAVAVSPDGTHIATASADRTIQVWNIAGEPRKVATLTGHTNTVYSVAFSHDGRTLASGSWDRTARLWDVAGAQQIAVLGEFSLEVKQVAFSPDGRTLAAGSDDRTVRFWDVTNIRAPAVLSVLDTGHTNFVSAVAFSPDGRTFATGSDDRTLRLWDVRDPRNPRGLATLTGHEEVVMSVAFSPDGHTLASSGDDRAVFLWNVTDPAHPTQRGLLTGHNGPVQSVTFAPGDRGIATASTDFTVQLWDIDPGRAEAMACTREKITPEEWADHFPGLDYQPPCE